jgi:putative hemolysin
MQEPILSSIQTPIIFFFIALLVRGLLSFLETSVTALRLFKLKELAQETTGRYQALFQALEKSQPRVLITILIANSLADVTTAALATQVTERVFAALNLSRGLGFTLGIGIASIAIVVFGEIIPKNLARGRSERLFRSMLWLTNLLFYVLYPLATLLMRFSDFIVYYLAGKKVEGTEWITSEREIRFLIEYINQRGLIEPEKKEMLQNIFELGTTPVREIMVPATDVVSIEVTATISETLEIFKKHQFTRMPVYEDQPDNIIGMVHQKDIFVLLSKNEDKPLKDIVRPIMFIPESIKVNQLLREFRQQHMHIAIVLNEHGIVTGLITLEDVLEEIVGEISDEHEHITPKIAQLKDGSLLIDASIPLEELEEFMGITFEAENAVTLAGFLTEQLQHLPKKGERILYKSHYFQIQKASYRRVYQVLVVDEQHASQLQ